MPPQARRLAAAPLLVGIVALAGCQREQPKLAPPKPAEVVVDRPTVEPVQDYEDFTGRTDAFRKVEVRARVTGYLDKVNFKDGQDVKSGEVLFEIDPRTYLHELDRTKALAVQAQALLERTNADFKRAETAYQRSGNTVVSREEFDRYRADKLQAEAGLKSAEAAVHAAELNLEFTKVTAPFDGRISRRMVDPGNLVKADDTMLTTIVSLDPIYVYFDIDERTLLTLRKLIREGKMPSYRVSELTVGVGLADEEDFSLKGGIDFSDNQLEATTGTLRVRAKLANPRNLLSPGLYARVRLPVGKPYDATLVPEQALGSDQGRKFVYVVNDKDEVEYRPVKLGQLHNNKRVVREGVKPGERVVVSGQQRVRPGAKATVKEFGRGPDKEFSRGPEGRAGGEGRSPQ